ncbi:MAG: tagaturonate epimerase family protein [Bryobacterales bacterium]
MRLERFSIGVGDRFAHEAVAQLRACMLASEQGADVVPVWNKSNREHNIVGSKPQSVRDAADAAVRELGWRQSYYVDADHINLGTVDAYLDSADFFTLDVADWIGKPADSAALDAFLSRHPELVGKIRIPDVDREIETTADSVREVAAKYLTAVQEAGRIYRHIESAKDAGSFVTEVSMDETDAPQTPPELLIILAALADEEIPLQTIAPKFTGRFNKGVDYVGDLPQFEKEINEDLAVIAHAVQHYGLPDNLKLSVHSGSDKFSIYAPIRRAVAQTGAGLHLKTAGTTWLEELIGLAEAGGDGLALAKEVYAKAYEKREALCEPYATVIDIDESKLPSPEEVAGWSSTEYVGALRHDPTSLLYNQHLRQLLHVGFKIAAQMGDRYTGMLVECRDSIERNVTTNLFERHLRPLFVS